MFSFFSSIAQEGVMTVGVQFKPIIPSNLFRAGDFSLVGQRDYIKFNISQKVGYSMGMIIRKGINQTWSFETGIKYTKRNFKYAVDNTQKNEQSEGDFSIVGYEVPALALLNVRLDKNVYMNAAFGPSFDMFPSNVQSYTEIIDQYSIKRRWLQLALIANLGWEYRTKKSGTFYLGGSYHRPFKEIYQTRITYISDDFVERPIGMLSGNYLTVDVRYFFHEDPEKKKNKAKHTN